MGGQPTKLLAAPTRWVPAAAYMLRGGMYQRAWASASEVAGARQSLHVVQFNILADGLSGKHPSKGGFTEAPPGSLEWEYRRGLIMKELFRHCKPDVVAMQEVDHYEWLSERMAERGYEGTVLKKPDSACKGSLDPSLEDGCALFWRREFERVEITTLGYRHGLRNKHTPSSSGSNQVALVAALRPPGAASGPPLLFATTHLCAAKSSVGETVRAQQMRELVEALQEVSSRLQAAGSVLMLDMNASPPHGTMTYESEAYPLATDEPSSGLRSAYKDVLGAEPAYTTWKRRGESEVRHTIDYVLVSPRVRVHRVLQPPDPSGVDARRLPGWRYPSDHIALAAEISVLGALEC